MKEEQFNRYREEEKEEKEEEKEDQTNKEDQEQETEIKEATDEDNELKNSQNKYLRVLADFENYKKRINEERQKERKYANQSLLERLVSITDIFDKAVNTKVEDEALKNFLFGFNMINNSFKDILESEEVKKIEAVGKKFDPKFHHAMETEWDPEQDENIVLEELQTGYTFKDRLLRPSLVKVNQKKKGNDDNE